MVIESKSGNTRISAPAHPSATGIGRVSGLVVNLVVDFVNIVVVIVVVVTVLVIYLAIVFLNNLCE